MKNALPPLVTKTSKILILGTMPGERSIALQQYYGNRGNHFWKILFTVLKEEFSLDYTVRKELLSRNNIALWNVLASCEREGSGDASIKNEVPNDFEKFHKAYPSIRFVFFESKAAERYYKKYIIQRTEINYQTLPSTSGLNAGKTFAEKLSEWKTIASVG